ncbi:T9SS type A sorting domain-containing protein [Chryseobacterium fluminis]|uniref:T9SS type A sorting domain-containing protein n=1 Tax=Chryseobacterium fluminis TaxID=2983606 RepID=UPI00225AC77A|nr:T9SS type A sorting domain-containing protein [Chryseobacterium sp. MMS21-Ot14]UZT97000.1 T9SS type A sorting domain-containing protein [Chryseobacterium sp. MMS21-Ot14]
MKKQFYFILFLLLLSGSKMQSQATATVFITDLSSPNPMVIDGHTMYIGLYELNKIVKINLSQPGLPPTDVVTGVNRPYGLALKDHTLYISEFGANRISKFNLNGSGTSAEIMLSNISSPIGLEFSGNDLYIALEGDNKIAKIDVTQPNPQVKDIASAASPFDIEIVGNDLYFTERFQGKVSKVSLNSSGAPTTVVQGLSYPSGISHYGNEIFVCEADAAKVSKFNITQPNPVLSVGIASSEFIYPSGIITKEKTIFVSDFFSGSLLKTDLAALSVSEQTNKNKISVYPNPAKEYLTVANVKSKDYKIFDMAGNLIVSGRIERNTVNVSQLIKGNYIIQIGDVIKKFIKN